MPLAFDLAARARLAPPSCLRWAALARVQNRRNRRSTIQHSRNIQHKFQPSTRIHLISSPNHSPLSNSLVRHSPRAGFPDRGECVLDSDLGESPARLAQADIGNPGSVPGLFAFPAAITCRSSRRGVLTTRKPLLLLMLSGVLLLRFDARQLLELLFQLPPRNKRFKVIFGTKPRT